MNGVTFVDNPKRPGDADATPAPLTWIADDRYSVSEISTLPEPTAYGISQAEERTASAWNWEDFTGRGGDMLKAGN